MAYLKLTAWTAGAVAGMFIATSAVLKADLKTRLGTILTELDTSQLVEQWPHVFLSSFERIFGTSVVSPRTRKGTDLFEIYWNRNL